MDRTKPYFFGAILLLATASHLAMASQADYQIELGYELEQTDYANSENTKTTVHTISFEYFLEPVKIDNQPLAEAAFMNRISSFVAVHGQFDLDNNSRTAEGNTTALLYTHMQQGSPLRLAAIYAQQSADYTFKPGFPFFDYSYDRTITGLHIGSFIAQNTAIAFEYLTDKVDYSPTVYSTFDYTLTQTKITAKHLMPTGNGTMVNIEGDIGTDSYDNKNSADTKNTVIKITGEYYLNNMQSIGGGFEQISGDDNGEKGQAIAVLGKLFFTPKFFLAAKIRQFSGDGTSNDNDEIVINANMRF